MQEHKKRLRVLLVEDDAGHVRLAQEAFREAGVEVDLDVARDGELAMAYLRKDPPLLPDLILLDLNMPRMGGKEVLKEAKGDLQLRRIPIVVFTTSSYEQDVRSCYDLHANCYITKPNGFSSMVNAIKMILAFWGDLVRLPS